MRSQVRRGERRVGRRAYIKNCQRREPVTELYITIYEHLHLVLEPREVLATQVAD